jgi:hypothetical protein
MRRPRRVRHSPRWASRSFLLLEFLIDDVADGNHAAVMHKSKIKNRGSKICS